jgi:predicted ester cyclase
MSAAHFSIAEIIAEDDRVAVRLALRGVHGAPFQGIAPTGASVAIDGVVFYRLAAGQINESWGLWDLLRLLQQLGAIAFPR